MEVFRENLITYDNVIACKGNGRAISPANYVNAIKFISYRSYGYTLKESFIRTFPKKYLAALAKDTKSVVETNTGKYASIYNNSKAVVSILKKTIIAPHIAYTDIFHKAVIETANLASNARSETVRQKCLETLITNLKPPEVKEVEVEEAIENTVMASMDKALTQLAKKQRESIASGKMTIVNAVAGVVVDPVIIENESNELVGGE